MGKQDVKDKTIDPIRALQTGNLTTAQAQQMFSGVMPVGDYKGVASILDLDLLVKQPLVDPERRHILGILDGREEDYDLQTLAIVAGELAGTLHSATIVVPLGEVWFINVVRGVVPFTVASTVTYDWWCSLWTDRIAAAVIGQPFWQTPQTNVPGGPYTYDAEFSAQAALWSPNFKDVSLRAPGGTIFTCVFATGVGPGEAINCTFQIFGYIGKALVD